MSYTTTRQAAVDAMSDKLAKAEEFAREKLVKLREDAHRYYRRRWFIPDPVAAKIDLWKDYHRIAEDAQREHDRRHQPGQPVRTGQRLFEQVTRR